MDKYLAAKVNTPFRVLFFWVRYGRNERAICVVHVFMSPLPIYHSRKAWWVSPLLLLLQIVGVVESRKKLLPLAKKL
ncbi:hypothetical protein O6H91_10G033400 [Diphasiastrum complanatum]|uniref:Uncharacterized protein n=1 Tax=Diphasiastrum complanatum TaxID=34168 RepID=A0ACC2CFW1_DIPCM|nr:hypothetical protein O6H91_10G033400 [Diphasiastrum complanatum]